MSGTPAPGCNGTVYNILKEGSGAAVTAGATVTVHATGVVKETGKKFWYSPPARPPPQPLFPHWLLLTYRFAAPHPRRSTKDPGQQPFEYQAGVGQVIKGWDQGLLGMKLGEQRQVIIPGPEAYGPKGFPAWGIGPNATLDFTLEVLKIQ
jgi:peptidylprolyl isomerase